MDKSTEKQFLEELDIKPNVLEIPLTEESAPVEEKEETEEDGEKLKNRRERRLYKRLEARGEETQKLAEEVVKLRNVVEAKTLRETSEESDYLKLVEKIYGNATPEAQEATELLKKALEGVHDSAYKKALEDSVKTFESQRDNEVQAVKSEENKLDEMMASLEDEYDTDFSDEAIKKGFLTLLEQLSPKDEEGNIIEFADPYATYELYESRKTKPSNRAKELASRGMTTSGSSPESKIEQDANLRFLRENGII